jgi:hypothetical protein
MKRLIEACLVVVTLASLASPAVAQAAADVPMQKGVAVDLPVTRSAVAIPEADKEDALVVAVTRTATYSSAPIKRVSLSCPRRSRVLSPIEVRRSFTLRPTLAPRTPPS